MFRKTSYILLRFMVVTTYLNFLVFKLLYLERTKAKYIGRNKDTHFNIYRKNFPMISNYTTFAYPIFSFSYLEDESFCFFLLEVFFS